MSFPLDTEKLLTLANTTRDLAKEAYTQSVAISVGAISETPAVNIALSAINELEKQINIVKSALTPDENNRTK